MRTARLLSLLLIITSCTFQRDKTGGGRDSLFESPSCKPISFAEVQAEIFGTVSNSQGKCISCHQAGGFLMDLSSYAAIKSRLAQVEDSVRNNRMPKSGPLPDDKKQLLFSWIQQGAPEQIEEAQLQKDCASGVDLEPTLPSEPPALGPPAPVMEPTYESLRRHLFAARCLGCHDSSTIFSRYDFSSYEAVLSYPQLFVIPEGGGESRFVMSLVNGSMPKNSKPLSPEQIEVVRQWVALGLPKTAADIGNPMPSPAPSPEAPGPANCDLIDYKMVQQKIFSVHCTRCHDFTAKLDLTTYSLVKNHLTEIQWTIQNDKMPPRKPLEPALKNLITQWIQQGAPETVNRPEPCPTEDSPTSARRR